MPRHKTSFTLGFEKMLNTPNASFLNSPQVFQEIGKQSGMSVTAMMKHIGKRRSSGHKEPSQKEKSQERLDTFKAACENK